MRELNKHDAHLQTIDGRLEDLERLTRTHNKNLEKTMKDCVTL